MKKWLARQTEVPTELPTELVTEPVTEPITEALAGATYGTRNRSIDGIPHRANDRT